MHRFGNKTIETDPGNHMLYSADLGVGKVAGIRLDPSSGEMTVQFLVDDSTAAFQPLIATKTNGC